MSDVSLPVAAAAAAAGGYLLGSIPFGLITTRLGGAGDIRSIGSGNIGATNVLRTGRRDLALLTLLGDGGKAALAAVLARLAAGVTGAPDPVAIGAVAGGAAFFGHLFPVWLGFKGGKGVATFFGTLLVLDWRIGVAAGATWLAVAGLARVSSLASLIAAALAPVFARLAGADRSVVIVAAVMALLIYVRHRENIARLVKGEEPRIGASRKPEAPAG